MGEEVREALVKEWRVVGQEWRREDAVWGYITEESIVCYRYTAAGCKRVSLGSSSRVDVAAQCSVQLQNLLKELSKCLFKASVGVSPRAADTAVQEGPGMCRWQRNAQFPPLRAKVPLLISVSLLLFTPLRILTPHCKHTWRH